MASIDLQTTLLSYKEPQQNCKFDFFLSRVLRFQGQLFQIYSKLMAVVRCFDLYCVLWFSYFSLLLQLLYDG